MSRLHQRVVALFAASLSRQAAAKEFYVGEPVVKNGCKSFRTTCSGSRCRRCRRART